MPVRKYSPTRPPDQDKLVDRLADEWRTPNPGAPEPVILEESGSHGDVMHVYVVWSEWAHITREQRGEIIMDAADRIKSKPDLLNITIAMGLTPDEADRFGIKWR